MELDAERWSDCVVEERFPLCRSISSGVCILGSKTQLIISQRDAEILGQNVEQYKPEEFAEDCHAFRES
jgi:hypothetical protein